MNVSSKFSGKHLYTYKYRTGKSYLLGDARDGLYSVGACRSENTRHFLVLWVLNKADEASHDVVCRTLAIKGDQLEVVVGQNARVTVDMIHRQLSNCKAIQLLPWHEATWHDAMIIGVCEYCSPASVEYLNESLAITIKIDTFIVAMQWQYNATMQCFN